MDDVEQFEVRKAFIEKIERKLDLCPKVSSPTDIQEKSFQEVLRHIVRVVSRKEPFETNDCVTKKNRKQCLKRILNQLQWMERKRLYDPPADDEIGYYLHMKKFMRSILAFFLATAFTQASTVEKRFGCCSTFQTLHNAEELPELNQHLSDLSVYLSDMDIENVTGSTFNPLMGIKDNYDVAQAVCGSKARGFMFYRHKFKLAQIDVRNTEFAFCPPYKEERRSYIQALDNIAPSLIGKEDDANVFSSELVSLYVERTTQEIRDIERHCAKIKRWILKNLSLTNCWDVIVEEYDSCSWFDGENGEEEGGGGGVRGDGRVHDEMVKFRKAVAEKCKTPIEDLPLYISNVDRCLIIAVSMQLLVADRYHDCTRLTEHRKSTLMREAVNSLTFLKQVAKVNCESMRKSKNDFHGQCKEENVGILRGILEDLRNIGGSNVELDEEEMVLVHKIWGSIASSVHFFLSAMAYEQEEKMMRDGKLCNVSELQASPPERRHIYGNLIISGILFKLIYQMRDLTRILYHYKTGLIGKKEIVSSLF